jgi:hypothetical protein
LLRFERESLALTSQRFELFLHFAQGGRLRGFALLQALLVNLQLFFQGFDERLNRFLPLFQITLGGFLKTGECFAGQP